MEVGRSDDVFFRPRHPYTELLVGSNPEPDPVSERGRVSTHIRGEIPSPINIPPGCRFAGRCPKVMDICREKAPELIPLKDAAGVREDRQVACYLYA